MTRTLQKALERVYARFFREMGIDPETGNLDLDLTRKFATYPYIGSRYGETKKILFVGQDIGNDPIHGCIQPFSNRRISIEDKSLSAYNPHIAGTYMAALYFLRGEKKWGSHWRKIADTGLTCQGVLKKHYDLLPMDNPLSYCALTNYYKFVTKYRKNRSGPEDKIHLDRDVEIRLFDAELEAFGPDIVVFQGTGFERKAAGMKKTGRDFYVGPHPSYREKGGRQPEIYVSRIKPLD